MEKKRNKAPKSGFIYTLAVMMLVTVVVVGIISAVGTANRTPGRVGIGTEDAVITGKKDNGTADITGTAEVTEYPKESTEAAPGPADTTKTEEDNTQASAPLEFCLPARGYISKDYSMDIPVYSLTMNDYRTHSGLDIQAVVGSAVSAVADGEVTKRYTDPFMGVCVEITHGGGLVSKYMNLGQEFPGDADVGCKVYGGQTIGCVGESAAVEAADTSHLHFELLQDDKHVNPLDYISYEPMSDEYKE